MFQAEENLCRQLLVSLHLSAGVPGSQKPQAATNQSHLHFHAAMAPAWPNPLQLIALAFLFYAIGELIPRPRGGSQENRRSAGKARGASSGRPEGENGPRPCHDPGSERRRSPLSLLIGGLLFSGIRATCFRALGRELSQGPPNAWICPGWRGYSSLFSADARGRRANEARFAQLDLKHSSPLRSRCCPS